MTLLIFTTKKDNSLNLFLEAAEKHAYGVRVCYYESLTMLEGDICYEGELLKIDRSTHLILRDPYNTGVDYSFFLRFLLSNYNEQVLLDNEYMHKYPDYEDKLFQASLLKKLGLNCPHTAYGIAPNSFPIILKKRLSSRARGIKIIRDREEYEEFIENKKISDYLQQEFLSLKSDYRVYTLKGELIGAAQRRPKFSSNGDVQKIKVLAKQEEIEDVIKQDLKKIYEETKAEFLGVDVVFDMQGNYYFIELNISPQFSAYKRVSGENLADVILKGVL